MHRPLSPKGRRSLPKELIQFGRHLVYAEGTKTEPNYIESIKQEIAEKYRCRANDIEIISVGQRTPLHTLSLVKNAKQDVEKRFQNDEQIDHVWIFFDKDDFPDKDFQKANRTIEKMNNSTEKNEEGFRYDKRTGIVWHSCFSNEAFELWYCLYFAFCESRLSRKEYNAFLNAKLKPESYSKTKEGMHRYLTEKGGNLENAIRNAKRLPGLNTLSNPSTGVYRFAEYFLPYMKKTKD